MIPFQNAFRLGVAAATVVAVAACSAGETEHAEEEHSHAHAPVFGGTLVELGDHFANLELTHDSETGEVKLYTWDAHVKGSQRSSTEAPVLTITPHGADEGFMVTLAPRVSKSSQETVGDSSLFTGQSDSIKGLDHFMVKLAEISLKGQTFKDIEFLHPADAHGDDDHDEDHDHDEDEGHVEDHDEDPDHESSDG